MNAHGKFPVVSVQIKNQIITLVVVRKRRRKREQLIRMKTSVTGNLKLRLPWKKKALLQNIK